MKLHLDDISLIYTAFEQNNEGPSLENANNHDDNKKNLFNTGIDLSQLYSFTTCQKCPLSDVLLAIIEIGNNSNEYNKHYNNQTKVFWFMVSKHNKIKRLLKDYSSTQSKRIWMTLRFLPQRLLIDFIQENHVVINDSHLNLVHIASICFNLLQTNTSNQSFYPHYKDNKALSTVFREEINIKKIKKKTINKDSKKYSIINDDILQKTQLCPANYLNYDEVDYRQNNQLEQGNPLYNHHKEFPILTIESYRKEFNDLDDIISILKELFPQYSNMYIVQTLHLHSCDIESTYNSLKSTNSHPNNNDESNKSFTDAEDYIIKYMKSTDLYNELMVIKGEVLVNKRKRYLNI